VIPLEEGIFEVRVAVTANPLVNDTLLLVALIVNATGVSVGVGVGVAPPPLDLEKDNKKHNGTKIKANMIFIDNDYLLIITFSVWLKLFPVILIK
jgi:hypothetical protein